MVTVAALAQAGHTFSSWLIDCLVVEWAFLHMTLPQYGLKLMTMIMEDYSLRMRVLIPGCMIPCMVGCASTKTSDSSNVFADGCLPDQ